MVPSTPEDAAGLLWTALAAEDPTIVLLPKHLIRKPVAVNQTVPAIPFGKAKICQPGSDVTLVTWGNCVEICLDAAAPLADNISVEIIDLRSIIPWDREAIVDSLKKTGRLVVVQEDVQSASIGQMLISELSTADESFFTLLNAPKLVSRPDVHIGYNPILEYAALPSIEDVKTALQATMDN